MFSIESDIAFRAKFAVELVQKRLATSDINAMYKLIVIDHNLNYLQEADISLVDAIRDLVS